MSNRPYLLNKLHSNKIRKMEHHYILYIFPLQAAISSASTTQPIMVVAMRRRKWTSTSVYPARDISSLQRHPLVMKVFIQKNTGLPSSAPVERLFSVWGQILTPRRNKLSDEHFEMLLLLRVNKHLVWNCWHHDTDTHRPTVWYVQLLHWKY